MLYLHIYTNALNFFVCFPLLTLHRFSVTSRGQSLVCPVSPAVLAPLHLNQTWPSTGISHTCQCSKGCTLASLAAGFSTCVVFAWFSSVVHIMQEPFFFCPILQTIVGFILAYFLIVLFFRFCYFLGECKLVFPLIKFLK